MNDVISVFGILLAVFTYIESLYHNDIHKCLELEVCEPQRANKLNYKLISNVILYKQYPLILISSIISIIMIPVSFAILKDVIQLIDNGNAVYDISKVTCVFINIAFVIINGIQIVTLVKLYGKKKKLKYK